MLKMRTIKINNRLFLILFLPLGLLIFYSSSYAPNLIERAYSNGIYKLFEQPLSLITGLFPFSLAEAGLIVLMLLTLFYIFCIMAQIIKGTQSRLRILRNFLVNLLIFICVIYFGFVVLWGLNNQRLPFSVISGMDTRPSTVDELSIVCEKIITRTNDLRGIVDEDKSGVAFIPGGFKSISTRAFLGFEKAATKYPELGGKFGRAKPVFFSHLMSFSGMAGVYCPFSGEANVNVAMPIISVPSTTCHEMAHQRGFAREDEANYLAYFTCNIHPDKDFQYSGNLLALIYLMNALYDSDRNKYNILRKKYSDGINRDLAAMREFWKRYEGPVQDITDSANDAYLKANLQKEGVKSYGRMVDLLIAEYRQNAL